MTKVEAGEGIRLNLGCGRSPMEGWVNVDSVELPGVDVVADLEKGKLPFDDESVREINGSHVIEHIRDPLGLMAELYRVAKPGAVAVFRTPYGSSDDADEDPTHVRRYFWGSWGYFSQPYYWRADYGYRGDWEVEDVLLTVDAEFNGKQWAEVFRAVQRDRAEAGAAARPAVPVLGDAGVAVPVDGRARLRALRRRPWRRRCAACPAVPPRVSPWSAAPTLPRRLTATPGA